MCGLEFGTENGEEQLKKAPCIYHNPHPDHEHNQHFVRLFLHNQDKKEHNDFSFRFSLTATVPCWLPFNMEDHPLLQASFNNKLEYKIEKTKYFPWFIQNPTWLMAQSLAKGVQS